MRDDNAIEACRRIDGYREIIGCVLYNDGLYISIRNTFDPVQIVDGNKVKASYTLVVTGDADGDGAVTVNDYVVIKAHILKKSTLTGVFAEVADADGDGEITVNDYVEVKAHILKKSSITAK